MSNKNTVTVFQYDDFHKGNLTYQISARGPQFSKLLDKHGEPMACVIKADLQSDMELNVNVLHLQIISPKVETIP